MIKNYFNNTTIQIKGIVTLDCPNSSFDRYIGSMYLEHINYTKYYNKTKDTFINILLLETFLIKNNINNLLILCSDYDCDNTDILENLAKNNIIFIISRKKIKNINNNIFIQLVASRCTNDEYSYKCGVHLSKLIKDEIFLNIPSLPFPPSIGRINSFLDLLRQPNKRVECFFECKGYKFSFICHLKEQSRSLVVVNQSAINANLQSPPVYQRWKWADDFNATTIVLNDPMLYLSTKLNGGWMIGSKNVDLIKLFIDKLKVLIKNLNISNNDVIFYGGSAGGYTSLQMSLLLPFSKCIVDIPQIDLTKYQHQNQIELAYDSGFGNGAYKLINTRCLSRLSVIEKINSLISDKKFFNSDIVFLMNINDKHHINDHLIPFIKFLKHNHIINISYQLYVYDLYHYNRGGHYPLGRLTTTKIINSLIECKNISKLKYYISLYSELTFLDL